MKILRWIGIAFVGCMTVMAGLIAIAPTLLSTSWGQGLCLKTASGLYPGAIEVQSLSMGWLSGIEVRGLNVKDPEGRDLFSCAQFSLDKPLISLVFSQKDFGSVLIASPKLYCYATHQKNSSSQEVSSSETGSKKEKNEKQIRSDTSSERSSTTAKAVATPDIKGNITVFDGHVVAVVDDRVIGSLTQGEAALHLDLLHASNGKIGASLSQNSSKTTPLALTFSLDGAPQLSNLKGSFSFSCTKVPTELLAALAHSLHPDIADFLNESFGSSVSYSLSATANGPEIVLHSTLLSDNLQSSMNMKVENDVITVDKGNLFSGTLTPRLFQLILNQATQQSQAHPITLLSPTTCSLENKSPLSIRLSGFDLISSLDIKCSTQSPLSLSTGTQTPPISLSVDTLLQGSPEKPTATIDISASSVADTGTFHFTASGSKKNSGYQLSTVMNINGKWPAIAETLSGFSSTSLFGPDLSAVVKAAGQFNSIDDFSLQGTSQLSSQNIQKTAAFTCTNTLFSVSQASFDAKVPSSFIETLGAPVHFASPVGAVHVQTTVKNLSVPLDHLSLVLPKATIDAVATLDVPTVALQPNHGLHAALKATEITVTKSEKSPAAYFSVRATAPVSSKAQPVINTLIGPTGLSLVMAGKFDIEQSKVTVKSVEVTGSRLSASIYDMTCAFAKGLELSLESPANARIVADKDTIESLSSASLPCTLGGPAELKVTVKPFTISQKDGVWQGSPLSAELQGSDIRISGTQSFGPYSLSAPVIFDMCRHTIVSQTSITSGTQQLLNSTATITLPENSDLPFMENASIEWSAELSRLPTSIIELLSHKTLAPIIGDTLSSKLSCKFYGLSSKGNRFTMSSSGASWKANVDCALDAMCLSGAGANVIDIEASVSPTSYEALKSLIGMKSDVTLGNSITFSVKVPQCSANLTSLLANDSQPFSPWKLLDTVSLSAQASVSALQLQQKKGAAIGSFAPLDASCELQGKNHSVQFAVNSSGSKASDAMIVAINGSFDTIWNKDGLTLPSSHLRSTVDIDRFPTQLLEIALPQQGALLEEAIGKTIRIVGNLSADEMKSGAVKVDLQADNCSMHLDGTIKDGKMTLKAPAKASLKITKQAGALLLKNVSPLLATAAHSEKPIQVTVGSEGAVIPISPFSLTGVTLPKITADIGKIAVKNGGALKVILAILNMGKAANSENLDLWLTPIYMRFDHGVLTCQRADMLVADKVHMITWGDVDLGNDRINMVVAIPQETLSALRLKLISPTPERGLQIPITGASSHPKVDTTSATARLAGAAIVDNVPDPRLQIFGGLLQAAASTMGEPDKPIPPPTTQPFPWQR